MVREWPPCPLFFIMSLKTEIADGIAEIEVDLGASFRWKNKAYACVSGAETRRSEYDSFRGGIQREDTMNLIVRAAVLTSGTPVVRDTITYNGRKYRIEDIARAPHNEFYVYTLGDPND